ncbi:MAG TPA: hypothetical protein VLI06_14135 [Solimonas sp.]|nr:hypothetical protein [Solimonas sp.]
MAGRILVAAGTNGAGKSSIVQRFVEAQGGAYFNPDQETRKLVSKGVAADEANGMAWKINYDMLRAAIDDDRDHAFETTLGGNSIAYEMMRTLATERRLTILFVGLTSVELHMQRVAERVARGGHDIPEDKIRARYTRSRENLLSFIGTQAQIRVWDNSEQSAEGRPKPKLMFSIADRQLDLPQDYDPARVPEWVKPLLARAFKFSTIAGV